MAAERRRHHMLVAERRRHHMLVAERRRHHMLVVERRRHHMLVAERRRHHMLVAERRRHHMLVAERRRHHMLPSSRPLGTCESNQLSHQHPSQSLHVHHNEALPACIVARAPRTARLTSPRPTPTAVTRRHVLAARAA